MKKFLICLAASTVLATAAHGQTTVYNTDLPAVNGNYGAGVATTTTTPNGTVTTVVGPGGPANRASSPNVANEWGQKNVGGDASVGITMDYARSGNGSAFFQGASGDSKADLEYYFSALVPLTSFQSASYDWYRDSSSTNAANQVPSLRLAVTNGTQASYLIFEPVYNGVPIAPTDAWQTSNISLASTMWVNNGAMNEPASAPLACPDCYATLGDWIAANTNWSIYGLSTGIGSGWNGTFRGGVDNIAYNFGTAGSGSFNFEVAAGVPEPATWAFLIVGFGAIGASMRSARRREFQAAAA